MEAKELIAGLSGFHVLTEEFVGRLIAYIEAAEAEKAATAAACEADVKWLIEGAERARAILLKEFQFDAAAYVGYAIDHLLKTAAATPARVEPEAKREPTIEECIDVLNCNGHMGVTWAPVAAYAKGDVFRHIIDERGVREIAHFYLAREAEGGGE